MGRIAFTVSPRLFVVFDMRVSAADGHYSYSMALRAGRQSPCTLRTLSPLLRGCQIPLEGKSVAIQSVESEFARSPLSIVNLVRTAVDATLPIFVEECVWILHQKPQADG